MGHARERGETRAGSSQIRGTLTFVDRDTERATTGREPADDVAVDPAV
jgi:hypothetical protein